MASSRSVRMRWNWARHAVSGYGSLPSSMSRMARASEFRLFWMRSSSSESVRLRSAVRAWNCWRLRSCTMAYPEYTATADSVTASPARRRTVGERLESIQLSTKILRSSGFGFCLLRVHDTKVEKCCNLIFRRRRFDALVLIRVDPCSSVAKSRCPYERENPKD
ncbi:exported hypothetical protein [Candidatus Sulfopaludibacter sp. SbA4]|nr:exported hypothetical protein [Candidatus Sulfopaludibacter sp. SbA4]